MLQEKLDLLQLAPDAWQSRARIPNRNSRRWSEDDIPARFGRVAKRQLSVSVDSRIDERQMLYALPTTVAMQYPDFYRDLAAGIDWQYQPAFFFGERMKVLRLGGIYGRTLGKGYLSIQPVTEDPAFNVPPTQAQLNADQVPKSFTLAPKCENPTIGLKFSNGTIPDQWTQLHLVIPFAREVYDSPAKRHSTGLNRISRQPPLAIRSPPAHIIPGWAFEATGLDTVARIHYESSPEKEYSPAPLASLGHLLGKLGQRFEAVRTLGTVTV